MPEYRPGQHVVLPDGTLATVDTVTTSGMVYVRKEGGGKAVYWTELLRTRAAAIRTAQLLLGRIANDVGAYRLAELSGALAPYVSEAAILADAADAVDAVDTREVTA